MVPLFDTVPVLLELCVALTLVVLLSPRTVVLTMFCEPIAVIDSPGPPKSMPCLAAFTWPAELPSCTCMVLESAPEVPFALEEPHILPDELLELDELPDALCASAAVERIDSPAAAKIAPIGANSFIMIQPPRFQPMTLHCRAQCLMSLPKA